MASIRLVPDPHRMLCHAVEVPAFPGERFALAYPESLGSAETPIHFDAFDWQWTALPGGAVRCRGGRNGVLRFELVLTPGEDVIRARFALTNLGPRPWERSMAFNCLQCGQAPSVRDHDGTRHWVRAAGEFRRLVELPRVHGPRPTIQAYLVEGGPELDELPFVRNLGATPPTRLEPWIAIAARSGSRWVATVSDPGLFLFHNREYSCIHAATGFGAVQPGGTVVGENRVYFVEASLAEWHARMGADLGL